MTGKDFALEDAYEYIEKGKHMVGFSRLCSDVKSALESIKKTSDSNKERPKNEADAWIYDNADMIYERADKALESLKRAGKMQSAKLSKKRYPRIFVLAYEYISENNGSVDEISVIDYLRAADEKLELKDREIRCFDVMLVLAAAMKLSVKTDDVEFIKNTVTSLLRLSSVDFSNVFFSVSFVERILLEDPLGIYGKQDEATRNFYHSRVEKLSRIKHITEREAAYYVLNLAREGKYERERHVGFYLTEGIAKLERERDSSLAAYVFYTAVPFAIGVFLLWMISENVFSVILGAIFLFEIIKKIVSRAVMSSSQPTVIPRMDFECGVPDSERTLAVISVLLDSKESVYRFTRAIEEYYHANRDENIYFGILGDLKDTKEINEADDLEIISFAKNAINELNEKYDNKPFCFFARKREYNEKHGRYMSYERKRGAIMELSRLINRGDTGTFSDIICHTDVSGFNHVVTLDFDTRPTIGSVKRLIETSAHPLNSPVISDDGTRVISGYGILQPRIVPELLSEDASFFSKMISGKCGISAYTNLSGDIYQDLFGDGTYIGKGLFSPKIFDEVLSEAIADNKVLSHDMLEGTYVRVGFVSDVEWTDSTPNTFKAFFIRQSRWTRGDFQLLPWLGLRVRNKTGKKVRNPIGTLGRVKIIENLIRSLIPPVMLVSVSAAVVAGSDIGYIPFILMLLNIFLPALWGVVSHIRDLSRGGVRSFGMSDAARSAAWSFMSFAIIPFEAMINLSAALVSVGRVAFTKRNLLDWSSAQFAKTKGENFGVYLKFMFICPVVSIVYLFFAPSVFSGVIAAIFLLAPFIAYKMSRPEKVYDVLYKNEQDELKEHARLMWGYFEDFLKPIDNYLIPDNFQTEPYTGPARRTSPTNIGLSLTSLLSSYDFGFIDKKTLFSYAKNILGTLEKLEKWNGHLYNWYDTGSLSVLSPRYVSSVDSGNFAGHLITFIEGLRELNADETLTEGFSKLLSDIDFSKLYSKERNLFHIGFNEDTGKLDDSYYDLLASEARLTSYIASALGQVPKKHWQTLSRSCAKVKGRGGLYSWTGTMFEYFMPSLLLSPQYGSLMHESQKFAVFCQKMRVGRGNIYGISESAYNAFDNGFSYQYKAFGISALSKKRDCDDALIISPYSTYLSLMTNKRDAVDNLFKLKSLDVMGKYGFFEAIDFKNTPYDEDYTVVKTFMAHHIGMSLVSCANAVMGNVMCKRFMSDVRMRAFRELLAERADIRRARKKDMISFKPVRKYSVRKDESFEYVFSDIDAFVPRAHVLGSRKYSSVITDSGIGFSSFDGLLSTRCSFDAENPCGMFFFTGDENTKIGHSLTFAPSFEKDVEYKTEMSGDSVKFTAKGEDFESEVKVISGAGKPFEVRYAKVKNTSDEDRKMCISLYFEPVLASFGEDNSHRTFSDLFIETSYIESEKAMIIKRRDRSGGNNDRYIVASFFGDVEELLTSTRKDKVRARISPVSELKNELFDVCESVHGRVISPCIFAKNSANIAAGESISLGIIVAAGDDVQKLIELCREQRQDKECLELLKLARARMAAESDVGRINGEIRMRVLDMLPCLYLNMPVRECVHDDVMKNTLSQSSLWKYGISGDVPIMIFEMSDESLKHELMDALKTFLYFYMRAVTSDLVILYSEAGEYMRPIMRMIESCVRECSLYGHMGKKGGIHIINTSAVVKEDVHLIRSCASFIFGCDKASRTRGDAPVTEKIYRECGNGSGLSLYNGYGGFLGDAYITNAIPPAPYSYVMSNGKAGVLVTSAGGGFSFTDNARENKITPMSFDRVEETADEVMRICTSSGEFCVERPIGAAERYVKYDKGCAHYVMKTDKVQVCEDVFVPVTGRVIARIMRVKNVSENAENIRAVFSAPLSLGVDVHASKHHSVTLFDEKLGCIKAKNPYNGDYSSQTTYLYSDALTSFTCEYEDVLRRKYDTKKTGVMNRACFCVCMDMDLGAGEEKTFVILMGRYEDEAEFSEVLCKYSDKDKLIREMESVKSEVSDMTSVLRIDTPDERLNVLVNDFLLYQTYVCRILARTSFYQCGGAWGFRDQLQDCLSLIDIKPEFVREHIIRACSHQFIEGDVQHWWHPIHPKNEGDAHRGVRTRYTDDRLWLVYTAMEYARVTDDWSIFDEDVFFIEQQPLRDGEHESYAVPKMSQERASVFEHCIRAVEVSLDFGEHGLCKIGGGDWNDGFNNVGIGGKGESVWLSWFLYGILRDFSDVCERFERHDLSKKYVDMSKTILENIELNAWDTDRYLRAFYDDGTPLGSDISKECRIDSLSQSFSVLSQPDRINERKNTALDSALSNLYDRENGLVRLFTPPFDESDARPGYVKGYTPGVRENGGQYTHASVWLCMALFLAGRNDEAYELLYAQNPLSHADTKIDADKYKVEPYVISADVYSVGENAGMGGWSWYTGAASWYRTMVVECLFGIKRRGDVLTFSPHLPSCFESVSAVYMYKGTEYKISYVNNKSGRVKVTLDSVLMESNEIRLSCDKNSHNVLIEV